MESSFSIREDEKKLLSIALQSANDNDTTEGYNALNENDAVRIKEIQERRRARKGLICKLNSLEFK